MMIRAVVVLVILALPAGAQELLFSIPGTNPTVRFGHAVAPAGDMNGDRVPDLMASALDRWVRVYSGVDGSLLRSWPAPEDANRFGHALASAGDVDGDGVPDVAVGAPGFLGVLGGSPSFTPGRVHVYSGRTAQPLLILDEQGGSDDEFGWSVCGAGDVDGDGRGDVLVGAPGHLWHLVNGSTPGWAYLMSGVDGSVIHAWTGTRPGERFGISVASTGDLDGDGVADVAIGATGHGDFEPFTLPGPGSVSAFSGRTGQRLFKVKGPATGLHGEVAFPLPEGGSTSFGQLVAAAGDVDGDGVPDLAIGSAYPGFVRFVSGVDGADLGGAATFQPTTWFGSEPASTTPLAAGGDVDGDGVPDVVAGDVFGSRIAVLSGPEGVHRGTLGDTLPGAGGTGGPVGLWRRAVPAILGDVTGDGIDDVAVGWPAADTGPSADAGRVDVYAGGSWRWDDLGQGLPGSGKVVPELRGLGTLESGTLLEFWSLAPPRRDDSDGGFGFLDVPARLVVGFDADPTPLAGGVLVPATDLWVGFNALGWIGWNRALTVTMPDGLPAGLGIHAQALFADDAAPDGVAFSNAVVGVVP